MFVEQMGETVSDVSVLRHPPSAVRYRGHEDAPLLSKGKAVR